MESNGKFAMIDSGASYIENKRTGCTPQIIHYLRSQGADSLEFYLGTHAHNDHISNAWEIINAFPTSRVYLGVYDDMYITEPEFLWDNQVCYNNLVKAVNSTGAELIQNLTKDSDTFQFGDFTIVRVQNWGKQMSRSNNCE